jgi:hypothetical protein
MKVLVCGSRMSEDWEYVFRVLDQIHADTPITAIIHGAASGVDSFASDWATSRKITQFPCPAEWAIHGKAAGPIRNANMLHMHDPDLVAAFPGGKGTKDMIWRAKRAGIRCRVFDPLTGEKDPDHGVPEDAA